MADNNPTARSGKISLRCCVPAEGTSRRRPARRVHKHYSWQRRRVAGGKCVECERDNGETAALVMRVARLRSQGLCDGCAKSHSRVSSITFKSAQGVASASCGHFTACGPVFTVRASLGGHLSLIWPLSGSATATRGLGGRIRRGVLQK